MPIRIAIIGFGKIATDQHLPAIAADPRFALVAVADQAGDPGLGVPWFGDAGALFAGMAGQIDAVAICTPPRARHAIAHVALRAGLDVLLEKPPAATLGEIEDLETVARQTGCVLQASWHSQHAPAVVPAARFLAQATLVRFEISWREDVRKWHPGQEWIWQEGGFGVFDPGINALSIASRILPFRLLVRDATLFFPENRKAPIAARLAFAGEAVTAEFDWRFDQGEEWTIRAETAQGRTLEMRNGGARLLIDGAEVPLESPEEYRGVYDHFATLIAERRSDIDREPLRMVADAFLVGRRERVEAFVE